MNLLQYWGITLKKQIIQQVKQAKYFSIIFDSTHDISKLDQSSQILRYVVMDNDGVQVRESFIDFIDTKDKQAAGIAEIILEKLRSDVLDIMDCRCQGYDDAEVMKGQNYSV